MNRLILRTLEEVKDWFFESDKILAFDWETTGLDYMKMEPVGISFSDGEYSCYVDLWENKEHNEILALLGPIFERDSFIAHNAKFDVKCCQRFCNVRPTDIFCTYIASFLLDENRPNHGLKTLAMEDLGHRDTEIKKWEEASQYGYHSDEFYKYGMLDSEWAFQLYELYKPQLTEQGLDHVFYDIEIPFVQVMADMEINGILIDQDELSALQNRVRNKLIELEDRMIALTGKRIEVQNRMFDLEDERMLPVNIKSPQQVIRILEGLGLTVPKKRDPKTGSYKKTVDKEALEKLKGKHAFVDYLIEYRKFIKLYDSYIIPAWGMIDEDGRIRPNFGIVKTGRTNCSNPNLQQLPRFDRQYPQFDYRRIFIAGGSTNSMLVGGDYSGQELRGLGEVSQDERILESFKRNFDLHLVTANYIFDLGLTENSLVDGTEGHNGAKRLYKAERYKAKNGVNFPVIYGSTEYGISHNMGVTVQEAREWRNKFLALYPGVKSAIYETQDELKERGYVSTLMGRRRRFPNYDYLPNWSKGRQPSKARCVRQAFNFKIQGLSADQIKIAAVKARKMGLHILLIIHDEIVIESSTPQQDVRTLKNCMEQAIALSIPYIADCKTGGRYSEIK